MPANGVVFLKADRSPIVLRLVDGLAKMIRRYRRYRGQLADIATLRAMSERDLKDIGVYRCDLDRIARQDD
jgi:uncharacterized protein YjiS (DUF1127 family)